MLDIYWKINKTTEEAKRDKFLLIFGSVQLMKEHKTFYALKFLNIWRMCFCHSFYCKQ